jgi:hypothetical protein
LTYSLDSFDGTGLIAALVLSLHHRDFSIDNLERIICLPGDRSNSVVNFASFAQTGFNYAPAGLNYIIAEVKYAIEG